MAEINRDQIKLGFWVGVGFLLLGLLLGLVRFLIGKVAGARG